MRPRGRPVGTGNKLTIDQVREIKRQYYLGLGSLRSIAKTFNCSHQNIFFIVNGCYWTGENYDHKELYEEE